MFFVISNRPVATVTSHCQLGLGLKIKASCMESRYKIHNDAVLVSNGRYSTRSSSRMFCLRTLSILPFWLTNWTCARVSLIRTACACLCVKTMYHSVFSLLSLLRLWSCCKWFGFDCFQKTLPFLFCRIIFVLEMPCFL